MRLFSVSLVIITNDGKHVETISVSANTPSEALANAEEIAAQRGWLVDGTITASIVEEV